MRLASLRLANFRSCHDCTIDFANHLTLLVGENDGGKTSLIDGIRLCTGNASGKPSLFFDLNRDLTWGKQSETISLQRRFTALTPTEEAIFTPVLLDAHKDLIYTTKYKTGPELTRRERLSTTVSELGMLDPEPENRDRIAHVYLPPLRDAARDLDSADGNRVADIIEVLCSIEDQRSFMLEANSSLRKLADHKVAITVQDSIQRHLSLVTRPVRHREVALKHAEQSLRRLARSLRLHMAAAGLDPVDLLGSGLGYANLLYIASVVLELERASEHDLTLLLVEEPEAHLHPQLQTVLLAYLLDEAKRSASADVPTSSDFAGRIQVIATSHSPHLASAIPVEHVVVVRSIARFRVALDSSITDIADSSDVEGIGKRDQGHLNEAKVINDSESDPNSGQLNQSETKAIAIASIGLVDSDLRKVGRYLNATRASLLFARQVILVEGIAEALLLRSFAEYCLFPDLGTEEQRVTNKSFREQLRAVTIIPIEGVDFEPYAKLLLSSEPTLVDRLVVLTDGDNGDGDRRRTKLENAHQKAIANSILRVEVGATTLEAELFGLEGNETLLRSVFQKQHPNSLHKWDAICPPGSDPVTRASKFSEALKTKRIDLGKGDFAHMVSLLLEDPRTAQSFAIPKYIESAIRNCIIATE